MQKHRFSAISLSCCNLRSKRVYTLNANTTFGSPLIGRSYEMDTLVGYRFSFNGKENDKEGMGGGNSTYDYGFRIYNPWIAKFLSIDPLNSDYPWYTPYQFAGNMPIWAIDIDGLEPMFSNNFNENGTQGSSFFDIKSGKTFNFGEGSASFSFDEKKLVAFTNNSNDKTNVWNENTSDYEEVDYSSKDVTVWGNKTQLVVEKSKSNFWDKYFYWAEEGYLEGSDNPTNQRSPTAKETAQTFEKSGEVLQAIGIGLTCVAPEAGIPLYKLGNFLESAGNIIEIGENLTNKNFKGAAIIAGSALIGSTVANKSQSIMKQGGADKVEQFATGALIDQSVKKATENTKEKEKNK